MIPAKANRAPSVAWIHRRAFEYRRTITDVEKATAYTQWMITESMTVAATIEKPTHRGASSRSPSEMIAIYARAALGFVIWMVKLRVKYPMGLRVAPASMVASRSWAEAAERNAL